MKEFDTPRRTISKEHKMQALFFHGETEAWRRERYIEYKETTKIVDLMELTKNGEEHYVGWLERKTADPDTNEQTVHYHAACKCIALTEDGEDPDLTPMFNCYTWQEALLSRAEQRRQQAMVLNEMLRLSLNLDVINPQEALDAQDEAILLELKFVNAHPERWVGNIRGGLHEIPLLSVTTGLEEPELVERAHRLRAKGWIWFDGEQTVALAA